MISVEAFGPTPQGDVAQRFTLSTACAQVALTNFGATWLSCVLPDAQGTQADVLLGFDKLEGYFDNPACYGATIGPSANRTALGELFVAGTRYQLPQNEGPNQQNNLHTDLAAGLHKRLWQAHADDKNNAVTFSFDAPDGLWGLPGNRHFTVRYTLTEEPSQLEEASQPGEDAQSGKSAGVVLTIEQRATTDAPTFVNMTNHSYFNLAGIGAGSCLNTHVRINAANYLPVRADSVSEGTIDAVAGTPFDFRQEKPLGQDIDQPSVQLARARGYDHCMVVDGFAPDAAPREALVAHDPESGRTLRISITTPGAHLYTGNWLDDKNAKAGVSFAPRDGFAFEPEFMPDCAHHPAWPQPVCTPEHPWSQTIVYRFGTN